MKIHEDMLKQLPDAIRQKAENAKTPEELLAIAKESGYELTEEQINSVAGGNAWECEKAPGLYDFSEC